MTPEQLNDVLAANDGERIALAHQANRLAEQNNALLSRNGALIAEMIDTMRPPEEPKEPDNTNLRRHYAGLALQALITKAPFFDNGGEFGQPMPENFKLQMAESAYGYADAMIQAEQESK